VPAEGQAGSCGGSGGAAADESGSAWWYLSLVLAALDGSGAGADGDHFDGAEDVSEEVEGDVSRVHGVFVPRPGLATSARGMDVRPALHMDSTAPLCDLSRPGAGCGGQPTFGP
jgi:hypothetical protein